MDLDSFLTTEELAARWRRSPAAAGQMRHRGQTPPAHRIGKRVLYRLADVLDYEATVRAA
jgi:hypothetical protein